LGPFLGFHNQDEVCSRTGLNAFSMTHPGLFMSSTPVEEHPQPFTLVYRLTFPNSMNPLPLSVATPLRRFTANTMRNGCSDQSSWQQWTTIGRNSMLSGRLQIFNRWRLKNCAGNLQQPSVRVCFNLECGVFRRFGFA
jgi:hypothetical protein